MNRGILFPLMIVVFSAAAAGAAERTVEIDLGDMMIGATLQEPDLAMTWACALIIAGSGPTDRNGNSAALAGPNNSLKYLAQGLAEKGVVSLRYDKRMVGQSVKPPIAESDLRFDHYIQDAAALANWLRQRCQAPLALVGHSEGGHIAIAAAAEVPVEAVVVLAGPGRNPVDLIEQQLSGQLSGDLLAQSRQALDQLRNGRQVENPPVALASLLRPSVQPYLISWFAQDPSVQIAELTMPVLLVYGDTDLQVPVADGRALAKALPAARLETVSGMNHVLKSVDGNLNEQLASYSDPSLPLADELLPLVVQFLAALDKGR